MRFALRNRFGCPKRVGNMAWLPYLWIPLGYVIGSTPVGFLAGKLKGIDIREHGSGNIGATNVLRVLGKGVGYPVFALDVLKGVVPVLLARVFASEAGPVEGLIPVLTCVTTILGHNYTFWLGFKGGKGIATSAGSLFPLIPVTIVAAVVLWVATFFLTRYVSVASLVAAVTLPTSIFLQKIGTGVWNVPYQVLTLVVCLLAIWRHKTNILRLMAGTENRFEPKGKAAAAKG